MKEKKSSLPPLITSSSFLTNISKLTSTTTEPITFLHEVANTYSDSITPYGRLYRLSMPMFCHYIVTSDYKLARLVMEGDSSIGINEAEKTDIVRKFDYINKPSILSHFTSSKERHHIRKHIAVSFSLKNLKYTQKIIYKSLEVIEEILSKFAQSSTPIDISSAIIRLTFDIITESSFNTNFNTQKSFENNNSNNNNDNSNNNNKEMNEGLKYLIDNEYFLRECFKQTLNPLRKYMFWLPELKETERCRIDLVNFASKLMNSYIKPSEIEEDLSIMGRIMSCDYDDELSRVQDILVFLAGGHETSSHSITFLLIELVKHPDILNKLQIELDNVINNESRHNFEQFPSISILLSLPYLDKCIKESMRLWSVIGIGPKRVLTQDIEYNGKLLPKGSILHGAYHSMFRQSWINEPDKFIPERWDETNPQINDLKSMFIPFNVGTRQCIGQNFAKMEIVMVISYLIRFFEFKLITEPNLEIFLTVKATNVLFQVKSR